jgi:signal transduction histidine kinase/CheY-like chemotaxis protein
MPPPSWKSPSVLLITSPPDFDAAALRASTADAIVVRASDGRAPLDEILAARNDLPIIVLHDTDEQGALALVSVGADTVLRIEAPMHEIASAVRLAIARRAGRPHRRTTAAHGPVTFQDAPQLQAIARLSGGIAHEFNNLLTVVESNLEHLDRELPPDMNALREAAGSIAAAARQAAILTRQLLAFGRQQTLIPAAVDVNAVVGETLPALRALAGDPVRLATDLGPGVAQVRIDRDQMRDVLVNLVKTAREAMPAGGTVTIATDMHTVTDEEQRRRPWLSDGRFVRVRVSDTGIGVEEQALPHLFEPFFVGSPGVRGAGLAMSSVYGVVKQSGGFIWADSRVNQGTTVTILLPALDAPRRVERHDEPGPSAVRVLLVEDTDAVRQTLSSMLRWHGFAVTAAASAEEALELARTVRVDLLLTDVSLPGRSGAELAKAFRQISRGTPVIFMSGYTASSIDSRDLDMPRAFLQKPFPVQTLVDRIHEVLAWARGRGSAPDGPG